jgi:EAL domain-containing protein (putative c-di-GMP-specific phosphodiesterase class I)
VSVYDSQSDYGIKAQFERLISDRAIIPHFHPVVSLANREVVGFELLVRSKIPRLQTPSQMFSAAEYLNRSAELSELCRVMGYGEEKHLPANTKLFVNIHPSEPLLTGLLPSLHKMRRQITDRQVVVEIHESAITDPDTLNEFSAAASELGVEIAFDDFGVGRARLLELANVPPSYVKFDISLVRNIERQPRHHSIVLRNLIRMMDEIGCVTIAEGVETRLDEMNCRKLNFNLAQGFLYGKPLPVKDLKGINWAEFRPVSSSIGSAS